MAAWRTAARTPSASSHIGIRLSGSTAKHHIAVSAQVQDLSSTPGPNDAAATNAARAPYSSLHIGSLFPVSTLRFIRAPTARPRMSLSRGSSSLAASTIATCAPYSSCHMADLFVGSSAMFCRAASAKLFACRCSWSSVLAASRTAERAASSCHSGPALAAFGERFQSTPMASSRTAGICDLAACTTAARVPSASRHISWRFVTSAARFQSEPRPNRRACSSSSKATSFAAEMKMRRAPVSSSHICRLCSLLDDIACKVPRAMSRASLSSSPNDAARSKAV
mmetsp:Transcript_23133/g.57529  ORF Transcript_23133/g.57529 Transcript_23133/m.57529 type:complete len:281 (+) Transcript_23133:1616-2458(+)